MTDEKKKLEEAKAKAKAKVGETKKWDINTIKFQKDSGSGIIFSILDKAKKALTLKDVTERAVKAGLKNPARAKTVANWFVTNGIAVKDEKGGYSLVARTVVEETAVEAPAEEAQAAA